MLARPVVSSGEGAVSRFGRLNPVLRMADESSGLDRLAILVMP